MEHKEQLSVLNMTFAYDKKGPNIIENLSVSFTPGRITAILGANGCGKSTLLNLLAGVRQPDAGKIMLDGKNIDGIPRSEIAKKVSVVHQNNTAPSDFSVRKLVSAGRTPYRKFFGSTNREEDERAVTQALQDTDTFEYEERPIAALSGGQMQRVWLAMALAQQTGILLLDEITTYLDIHYQLEILHLIRELNQKRGTTILMVLHDINLAMEFCDEVIIMKKGHIIAQGDIGRAVTEEVLRDAFEVEPRIIRMEEKAYCIFERMGGKE